MEDMEVDTKSHIRVQKIVKLFKKEFPFLTLCGKINVVFYVNIGEMTCSEHD